MEIIFKNKIKDDIFDILERLNALDRTSASLDAKYEKIHEMLFEMYTLLVEQGIITVRDYHIIKKADE